MIKRYSAEEIKEMEDVGELCVCPYCDFHGHADDFSEICPKCGEKYEVE